MKILPLILLVVTMATAAEQRVKIIKNGQIVASGIVVSYTPPSMWTWHEVIVLCDDGQYRQAALKCTDQSPDACQYIVAEAEDKK